jgi:5,10-methylenetetrahydromethanopterin reductase
MRVAIRVPVGQPLPALADFIARCEAAGFDGVGVHDHPSSGRDAYLALALAARVTQRLRLFPATSSPVVRHPLLLASLAHGLPVALREVLGGLDATNITAVTTAITAANGG